MSDSAIGIFDSGIGGLSILSGIRQLMPQEKLLYVADTAHAPYGPKGESYIRERCDAVMDFFISQSVKAVVVACNTATAAAIAELRQQHPIPLVGVEPAVKPAAAASRSGVVGVMATSGTIASDKFISLQNRFNSRVEIITCPCPGLVEAIEQQSADSDRLDELLDSFITPMLDKGMDTLVLGCTHYSLIREQIGRQSGAGVSIVDAGDAVARELQRRLAAESLLALSGGGGGVSFFSNSDLHKQRQLLERYWLETAELSAW